MDILMRTLLASARMLLVLTALTGALYPLAVTVIAQIFVPRSANGSLIEIGGRVVGSELIAQRFRSKKYFWPRPSAVDENPFPSGASNDGPTSDALRTLVQKRRLSFLAGNDLPEETAVPNDMLFASGSGVDPDISPAAARLQIGRVARARSLDDRQMNALSDLVSRHTEGPQFGLFGEPRVNVLLLNVDLDSLK